jgi:hypothetical protein
VDSVRVLTIGHTQYERCNDESRWERARTIVMAHFREDGCRDMVRDAALLSAFFPLLLLF